MKRILFSTILLLTWIGQSGAADDVPKPYSFARYQVMMDHSPFAVATAPLAAPTAPSFAKDLYVANAAKSPEGDMVTIASNVDKTFKKYLVSNTPNDGYSISSIEWSDKVGATKVTIAKDGQTATLTFHQAMLTQPIAGGAPGQPAPSGKEGAPAMGAPPAPASVAIPTAPPKAMPVPSLPMPAGAPPGQVVAPPAPAHMAPPGQTPATRVRGVIPRSPQGASTEKPPGQ